MDSSSAAARQEDAAPRAGPDGSLWNLGDKDLKVVVAHRELADGSKVYYPVEDNLRQVKWDFDFGVGATKRNRETAAKRLVRIRQIAYKKIGKDEAAAKRRVHAAECARMREEKKIMMQLEKEKRKEVLLRKRKRKELEKPKVSRTNRHEQRKIIAHMAKTRRLYLEVRQFPVEFEEKSSDPIVETSSKLKTLSEGDGERGDRKHTMVDRSNSAALQMSAHPIPRPKIGNDFSGTAFYNHNDEVSDLISLWSALQVYKGCLADYAESSDIIETCFPPALSPIMLAHVMEQKLPSFSTIATAKFYREPTVISMFDKIVSVLVRVAFREMLNRLATHDSENPLVPNWQMRYTTRSSMYCFFKGPECVNDVTWPEYTRRLLSALDRERDGADIKKIVQCLRGQTSSTDILNETVTGSSPIAPTRDSEYLPPAGASLAPGLKLGMETAMAPWLRARCLFLLEYILSLPDAGVFAKPVDISKFPTYTERVEDPMDLGTVQKYLLAGRDRSREVDYRTIGDFVHDVRLVWSNCTAFNSPDSAIIIVSENLSRHFERGLKLWVLGYDPSLVLDYGSPLEVFRKIMQLPWANEKDALAPRHPSCYGRSSRLKFNAESTKRYDIEKLYDVSCRSPVYFGRECKNPVTMESLKEKSINSIMKGQSAKWMVENNIASDAEDKTLQHLLRVLETTERCDIAPFNRLRLCCFLMELVSDGEIARRHINNQIEELRAIENGFDRRGCSKTIVKKPMPNLENVPGLPGYEYKSKENQSNKQRKKSGTKSGKKSKSKKPESENLATIDWDFFDKFVLTENGLFIDNRSGGHDSGKGADARDASPVKPAGSVNIRKTVEGGSVSSSSQTAKAVKEDQNLEIVVNDNTLLPKTCALCGLLAKDLAEKFQSVCWLADPARDLQKFGEIMKGGTKSSESEDLILSNTRPRKKRKRQFIECPICCPGSGKEEGHKGRHRLQVAKIPNSSSKRQESDSASSTQFDSMHLKLRESVSRDELKTLEHGVKLVHKSCANVLKKCRSSLDKYRKRDSKRLSVARRIAFDASLLRRENVYVVPLGRDAENAQYYMFGGDSSRLYVARPGTSIDDSNYRMLKFGSGSAQHSTSTKKNCEQFALNWSWYGSKQEVQSLVEALKSRCRCALDSNNHWNKSEHELVRALDRELAIWGADVAGTLHDAKLEVKQYNKKIENVLVASSMDTFECYPSRQANPSYKFDLLPSSYMILPRLSVVGKCMRDATYHAYSKKKQDQEPLGISPLKLLPKPQPPMELKRRKILKAEYYKFQVQETGMKGPPKWPPNGKMKLQYTIELNGDGLGLDLKSTQKAGGSCVRIVDIKKDGAAVTSCPEIQVGDTLVAAGGISLLNLTFNDAIQKLLQAIKACENGKLEIAVERKWAKHIIQCPQGFDEETFSQQRREYEEKGRLWEKVKDKLEAQMQKQFESEQAVFSEAKVRYERECESVEAANRDLVIRHEEETQRKHMEIKKKKRNENAKIVKHAEMEKVRGDLVLFGNTLPSDVFLPLSAPHAKTERSDDAQILSNPDPSLQSSALPAPVKKASSLTTGYSDSGASNLLSTPSALGRGIADKNCDAEELTNITSPQDSAEMSSSIIGEKRFEASSVGVKEKEIWLKKTKSAQTTSVLMESLLELEARLGEPKTNVFMGKGIAMLPGVLERNYVMCPLWPNPFPESLLRKPTCAMIAGRLYALEYAAAQFFSNDCGQSTKNSRNGEKTGSEK